jgi:hypothetical protein
LKDNAQASEDLRLSGREHYDVVNEDVATDPDQTLEDDLSHRTLKPRRSVGEPEGNAEKAILSKGSNKCRPVTSVIRKAELMIPRTQVHAREELVAGKIGKDGRSIRKRIPKFGSSRIELGVVDAHSDFVFLDCHDDRGRKAGSAGDNDALLE